VNDPNHGDNWLEAIKEKVKSLVKNVTLEELILPEGSNLVTTRWVFDGKGQVNGKIERFKARLVARGFSQHYGKDYFQTLAPTVRSFS